MRIRWYRTIQKCYSQDHKSSNNLFETNIIKVKAHISKAAEH